MKKYEINLMFFSGFYESIHDGVFDFETDNIIEDFQKEYDDFRFTYDYMGYCKNYVKAISREIGIELKLSELIMPRDYNFTTDEIICLISSKDIRKIGEVKNSDTLKNLIKSRFTSRRGFISFYSNKIDEWNEKKLKDWDSVELGTLLDAWLFENKFNTENNDLDFLGYEYCSGNGQYVDFEKCWELE